MLPDNYYPKAGDMLIINGRLCVFAASGVDRVTLVRFSDRYDRDSPENICLSSIGPISTKEVYTVTAPSTHRACALLGNVDFAKIAKEILRDT